MGSRFSLKFILYLKVIEIAMREILKIFSHNHWQLFTITVVMTTGTAAIAQQPAKKTDSEYINRILPEAQRIQQEYGIPLDLTLAIARQESGNGDYVIGKGNHFGLRCDSDDCITLEKNGRMINYETCPDISECFNIFAESINALTAEAPITLQRIYENGYATSPQWVDKVKVIREEVRQTLSEAGIKY